MIFIEFTTIGAHRRATDKRAEGIPMVEEVRSKLVELHSVVGSKGKSSMVVDVKLTSSLI